MWPKPRQQSAAQLLCLCFLTGRFSHDAAYLRLVFKSFLYISLDIVLP